MTKREECVEVMARAKFAHIEGIAVTSDSVRYWFAQTADARGEDADCYSLCEEYRAEVAVTLDAALRVLGEPDAEMRAAGGLVVAGLSSGRAITPYEDDAADALRAMLATVGEKG